MKTVMTALLIAAAAMSFTAEASRGQVYFVDAKVLKQDPTPERCEYVQPRRQAKDSTGTGVGAVAGGLIARDLSRNKSKKTKTVNTVLGALVGGSIGSSYDDRRRDPRDTPKLQCKSDGFLATVGYIHPVTQTYQVTTVPLDRRTRAQFISIPVR